MLQTKSADEKVETLLSKSAVPIIDLAHCGTEECPVRSVVNRVAHQLQKALSEKGMALLVNHGIADEKLKSAWDQLDDFMALPNDVKDSYVRTGDDNHGYVSPGVERFHGKAAELRHAYNICTLNAARLPEEPLPGFASHIGALAKDFKALASFILQALAVSLEIPQSFFHENHARMLSDDHENETTLRLLYYPPIIVDDSDKNELVKGQCTYSYQRCLSETPDFRPERSPHEDAAEAAQLMEQASGGGRGGDGGGGGGGNGGGGGGSGGGSSGCGSGGGAWEKELANGTIIRCGEHTDYGTFTLLAQDSEGGLEVRLPDTEKWERVGHLPGAILLNCGEILSVWTRGRYPALSHRVIVPEQPHLRARGRHSIAFFCHPDNITMISPNDVLLPDAVHDATNKKTRKKSFKAAKEKVYNAYQMIQKRFRDTYSSSTNTNHNNNNNNNNNNSNSSNNNNNNTNTNNTTQ